MGFDKFSVNLDLQLNRKRKLIYVSNHKLQKTCQIAGTVTSRPSQSLPLSSEASEWEATNAKLHSLRLSLLNQLVTFMPSLREVGGPRCIPFMQVILMLTTGKFKCTIEPETEIDLC